MATRRRQDQGQLGHKLLHAKVLKYNTLVLDLVATQAWTLSTLENVFGCVHVRQPLNIVGHYCLTFEDHLPVNGVRG